MDFRSSLKFEGKEYKDDEAGKMKELKWENGYIVNLEEGLGIVGEILMSLRFTILAQILTIGDAEFKQNWPEKG